MGARGEVPAGGGRIRGPAGLSMRSLARRNTLDEMTVGRTEVPLGGARPEQVRPGLARRREKIGAGSYEDPADEKRRRGRPKKTGRPRH